MERLDRGRDWTPASAGVTVWFARYGHGKMLDYRPVTWLRVPLRTPCTWQYGRWAWLEFGEEASGTWPVSHQAANRWTSRPLRRTIPA